MPRPRRRALGLAFGGALLFVVGTSVQAGWVLGLSSLLLGSVLIGLVLPVVAVRGVHVERRAPSEAFQGDDVEVELVVANRRGGVKPEIEVHDRHVASIRVAVPPLRPRAGVAIGSSRPVRRRGRQHTGSIAVSSSWPFGVAVARRRVAAVSETLVYPRVEPLGDIPLMTWARTQEHSAHTAPRRGTGPEYLGIREYRAGDSMRHVHWPSTARHGRVMVREFEQEHTRRLAIVIDTSADEGTDDTALDRCCSVAASVAFAALARGRGVRLLAAREGELDVLSRAEPTRILGWLAELPPFGGLPLGSLCERLGAGLRGVETLVVAAPSWRANSGETAAVAALAAIVPTLAVALVEAHGHAPASGRSLAMDPDETDAFAAALAATGADVYRVARGRDLAACLHGERVPA